MKTLKLKHIDTGGHGYVSVSKELVKELDLVDKISSYSGMNMTRVFLEEDCDAALLIDAAKERGYEVVVDSLYNPKHTCTHNYNPKYFDLKVGDKVVLSMNNQEVVIENINKGRVKLQGYPDATYAHIIRCLK
jgi:hypothetical protein